MASSLYREELLDHYRHPRNRGTLDQPDVETELLNPSCGDKISLQLKFADNKITAIAFQGTGCVISQAAASLVTERVRGMTLDQVKKLTKDDVLELLGISLGPTRLRCALLILEALHTALSRYQGV